MPNDLFPVVLVASMGGFFAIVTTVMLILQHAMHAKMLSHQATVIQAILDQMVPQSSSPWPTWPNVPANPPSYVPQQHSQTLPPRPTRQLDAWH